MCARKRVRAGVCKMGTGGTAGVVGRGWAWLGRGWAVVGRSRRCTPAIVLSITPHKSIRTNPVSRLVDFTTSRCPLSNASNSAAVAGGRLIGIFIEAQPPSTNPICSHRYHG